MHPLINSCTLLLSWMTLPLSRMCSCLCRKLSSQISSITARQYPRQGYRIRTIDLVQLSWMVLGRIRKLSEATMCSEWYSNESFSSFCIKEKWGSRKADQRALYSCQSYAIFRLYRSHSSCELDCNRLPAARIGGTFPLSLESAEIIEVSKILEFGNSGFAFIY